ncbi:MAG TPA: hypothetical protein VNV66_00310 [Pilimelia sp.]|nr:hypothetical protein [Pilimelia sp.]
MTTTMKSTGPGGPAGLAAPGAQSLRIAGIAANLMPDEIVQERRTRRIRRGVIVGLSAVLLGTAGWYGIAVVQTAAGRVALAQAESDVAELRRQKTDYADLIAAQGGTAAITGQLEQLMTTDVRWARVLAEVRGVAPAGVRVEALAVKLTSEEDRQSAEGGLPGVTAAKPIGQLTLNGVGPDRQAVARYLEALAGVRGLDNPYLGSATSQDDEVLFTMQITLTDAAVGGRYTPEKRTGGR